MRASFRYLSAIFVVVSLTVSGCYTKLMTPQEFVQSQRYQAKRTIADNSYSVNYQQSCVSCHSTNELNERYDEFSQLGITSVHNGIPFDPSRWENVTTAQQPIIYVPAPDPFWPSPSSPVNPWWAPVSTSGSQTAPATDPGTRIRDNGPTRDGQRNGERQTPIPSSTYTSPTTSGTSTSTPLPTSAPSTVNSAPTPAPPVQSDSNDRSRDSNSSSGSTDRTRDNGSTRDNSGARPR